MEIQPSLLSGSEETQLYLTVRLRLTNSGTHLETVDWKTTTVVAAEIETTEDRGSRLGERITGSRHYLHSEVIGTLLYPGDITALEFLIPITNHGLYLVEARIPPSKSSADVVDSAKGETFSDDAAVYSSATYVDTRQLLPRGAGVTGSKQYDA